MNGKKKNTLSAYEDSGHIFKDYPDVMDVKQVMSALHICRSGVYTLLKSGELHHFTIGRVYKIPKTSLLTYINRFKQGELSQ